jgi:hypothetical protein
MEAQIDRETLCAYWSGLIAAVNKEMADLHTKQPFQAS